MISVIIPTYKEEKWIGGTLAYLQGSVKMTNHEIIVSDSESPDKTVEIARTFKNAKVVTLPKGKPRGIAQGRNDGAAAAKGDIFVFTDADVTIPQPDDFFRKAAEKFAADPKLGAFAPRLAVIPSRSRLGDRIVYFLTNGLFWAANKFLNWGMAAGECIVIRASVFREVGGFRENLSVAEDMDLFARIAKKYKTRTALDLVAYHSGRRFEQRGAFRTMFEWIGNTLQMWTKKSVKKEWESVR